MPELKDACVKPFRGPIVPASESAAPAGTAPAQKANQMLARVGRKAIDFEARLF